MTTLDTMKLKIFPANLNYNKSYYHNNHILQDDVLLSDKWGLKREIVQNTYGLNKLEIDENENSIILELSAKILREQYMAGISNNTLDILVANINDSAGIDLSISDYLRSNLLRGDITKNIKVEDVRNSISVLKLGKSNSAFLVSEYDRANNCGIVFQGKQKSYKNRQIYYDKDTELTKVSRNSDFIKKYGNKEFFKSFENVLRIEQNITEQRTLKRIFKTETTKLETILNSDINPVLERHKIITKYSNGLELFNEYSNKELKPTAVIEEIGFLTILEKCNYNLAVGEDFLKSLQGENRKYKSTIHRYINKLRELHYHKTIKNENNEILLYTKKLDEIYNLLECA